MPYLNFFFRHPRFILFGFLNSFFSCLGQTHFIALFNPFLLERLNLTNTSYSGIYSVATIASGVILSFLGPLVDSKNLRYFCLFSGIAMSLSTLLFAFTSNLFLLFTSLFLLRLLGQGLFAHVMWTSIARYFKDERGKALALASLGFPLSEGLITPLIVSLLQSVGWQNTLVIAAVAVAFVYIPLACFLTANDNEFNLPSKKIFIDNIQTLKKSWTRQEAFSHWGTFLLLPQALMSPFLLSGLLFHQRIIGNQKGWSLEVLGYGFIGYAAGRIVFSFATGSAIDTFSAKKIFPYFLIPMIAGLCFLMGSNDELNIYGYMICCGIAVGIGGPVKAALWAEIFGTDNLGAIRSTLGTIIVFATGISPMLLGYGFDHGVSIQSVAVGFIILMVFTSISATYALKKYFS